MIEEKGYFSNTFAGTCNNCTLYFDTTTTITGRIFYKVSVAGGYNYIFYFSNNAFSTFDNGSSSYANLKGGEYKIHSAKAGYCACEYTEFDGSGLSELTFSGQREKVVNAGEEFWSNAIFINAEKDGYLVFEWTVEGDKFSYTPDKIIPAQVLKNGKFELDNAFPQPNMVACDRSIDKKVVFLGDSITQGLGTEFNAYKFWLARIGETLVPKHGVWNIGLGFGRAQDAASDKVWLSCAKIANFVNVCYGINDILQGRTTDEIKNDIKTIVLKLVNSGIKVGIFTVPPFDFEDYRENMRQEINAFIFKEIAPLVEYVFDFAKALANPEKPNFTVHGDHPDNEGCRIAAQAFLSQFDIDKIMMKG